MAASCTFLSTKIQPQESFREAGSIGVRPDKRSTCAAKVTSAPHLAWFSALQQRQSRITPDLMNTMIAGIMAVCLLMTGG